MLADIFEIQDKLNILIRRDISNASMYQRYEWFFEYVMTSEDKLYEFSVNVDSEMNEALVVDMLHCNTSICRLLNITHHDIEEVFNFDEASQTILPDDENTIDDIIALIWKDISCIKLKLSFKNWLLLVKFRMFRNVVDIDIIKTDAIKLFVNNLKLCLLMGMTFENISLIYNEKVYKNDYTNHW